MELYEKIKVLRKVKNLTQSQLAEKLDVTRQSVQKWESGISSPDISKLPEIASLFDVTTDILLDNLLTEEELLFEVLNRQNAQSTSAEKQIIPAVVPAKKQRSMLDWLILVPVMLGVFIIAGMFYVFGAMLIGFGFIFSGASFVGSFWSVAAIFINVANGAGSIIIAVGGIFLGLGLCAPLFYLSKWWLKTYRRLAQQLTKKIKSFDWRNI